jgi:hypothetical protein
MFSLPVFVFFSFYEYVEQRAKSDENVKDRRKSLLSVKFCDPYRKKTCSESSKRTNSLRNCTIEQLYV